jgi:hypothetical protein
MFIFHLCLKNQTSHENWDSVLTEPTTNLLPVHVVYNINLIHFFEIPVSRIMKLHQKLANHHV